MQKELELQPVAGRALSLDDASTLAARGVADTFGLRIVEMRRDALDRLVATGSDEGSVRQERASPEPAPAAMQHA